MRSTSSKQVVRECPRYWLYRLGCRYSGHLRIRINAVDAVSVQYPSGRGSHFTYDPLRCTLSLVFALLHSSPYVCCVHFGIVLCVVSVLVNFVGPPPCTLLSRMFPIW